MKKKTRKFLQNFIRWSLVVIGGVYAWMAYIVACNAAVLIAQALGRSGVSSAPTDSWWIGDLSPEVHYAWVLRFGVILGITLLVVLVFAPTIKNALKIIFRAWIKILDGLFDE